MKEPLKVLDIFSGIGGFSIGLENAGMETIGFCEIEPFAQDILNKHWPNTRIFTDVCALNEEQLLKSGINRVNVIAGGFPCQDISCAGKQVGIEGSRSGLWKEFKRLIDELRPDYAIIENVANLRSRGLITVLQDLWKIGYDAQWHCIPASAVGAPHRRDRIWIVAHPHDSGNRTSQYDHQEWAKSLQERQHSFNWSSGQSKNLADSDSKSDIRLSGRKKKAHTLSGVSGKDIPDSNNKGCNSNKGTSTRKNGEKGRPERSEVSITGRNITAGEGLSIHETRSAEKTTRTGLQKSEAVLADSDSTGALGIGRTDSNTSQESGCQGTNRGGSRGNDRGQHNASSNEKMADSDSQRLQGYGRFEEACQILTQEEVSLFCRSRGIEQWGVEPDTVPRLKDGRLNPDWVEWLMGFPIGWTHGGTRKQRLVALGNAVVPYLPELIGYGIVNNFNQR